MIPDRVEKSHEAVLYHPWPHDAHETRFVIRSAWFTLLTFAEDSILFLYIFVSFLRLPRLNGTPYTLWKYNRWCPWNFLPKRYIVTVNYLIYQRASFDFDGNYITTVFETLVISQKFSRSNVTIARAREENPSNWNLFANQVENTDPRDAKRTFQTTARLKNQTFSFAHNNYEWGKNSFRFVADNYYWRGKFCFGYSWQS